MKNILVVFTGGTIGSTAIAGTINTDSIAPFKLINLFQQHCKIINKSISARFSPYKF